MHRMADINAPDDWARARGLELDPETQPVVARYLAAARRMRTLGAVAGAVLPSLADLVLNGRVQVLGFGTDGNHAPYQGPISILLGYLAGALWAEVSLARPLGAARRSAGLVPRELHDYLPRRLLHAQRALGAAAALGMVLVGVVPFDPARATEPGWVPVVAGAGVLVAFTVGLEQLERWLVRRAQPFTSPALVAADDAIRAQSVHSLAGSGIALLLFVCSGLALALTQADVDALRLTLWFPAAVAFGLGLRTCGDVAARAWRVRRQAAGGPGTAT
jgi:hypothetical protein